jgi:chromosome segregation ATPase
MATSQEQVKTARDFLDYLKEEAVDEEAGVETIEKIKTHLNDEKRKFSYEEGKKALMRAKRAATEELRTKRKNIKEEISEKQADIIQNADKYTDEVIVELREEINELEDELEDVEEDLKEARKPYNKEITPLKKVVDNLNEDVMSQLEEMGFSIEELKDLTQEDIEKYLSDEEDEEE